MSQLDGRVTIVTGGARGVGRAIVEAFLAEGASVVLTGRSQEKGRRALAELGAGERAHFLSGDVMQRADCERMIDGTIARYGRVDVLVNNAGGAQDLAPVAELTDEAFHIALQWNLWSTFWCTRRALADMIPRRWGRVINTSSMEGKVGKPVTTAYVTAKHAVNGLTKSCAAEVGPLGITVNALCPGIMETDIVRDVGVQIAQARGLSFDEFIGEFCQDAATKQVTDTADVAAVAVLLASEAGAGITGALISIDGGTAPY